MQVTDDNGALLMNLSDGVSCGGECPNTPLKWIGILTGGKHWDSVGESHTAKQL